MTQYEIIQMANEAGLNSYRIAPAEAVAVWERFAALVEAKAAAKEGGYVPKAAPEGWQLSRDEMDLCRQWFNSVQDTNGGYLIPADYTLAAKIYERLGLRIPKSISNVLAAAPKP